MIDRSVNRKLWVYRNWNENKNDILSEMYFADRHFFYYLQNTCTSIRLRKIEIQI